MIRHVDHNAPSGWRYELTQEEHDDGFALFVTGPIIGIVTLPDGTEYNVTDEAIPVRNEHVGPLHVEIHRTHHAQGRLLDVPLPDLDSVSLT